MIMTPERSRTLNAIALLLVCVVLIAAFYYQFTLYELPCPLCLLQRVGFVAVGFGLALNLLYGARPHHYGIMLIGAIYVPVSGGDKSARCCHLSPERYNFCFGSMGFSNWRACSWRSQLSVAVMIAQKTAGKR